MSTTRAGRRNGFTLTEVLIVVALVGIILALSGPPLADYVRVQRLKGVASELATDLAFARSEAVSRGTYMQVRVQSGTGMTCYIVFARPDASNANLCDCTAAVGSRCTTAGMFEVKTVVVPQSSLVSITAPNTNPTSPFPSQIDLMTINPRTGGIFVGGVSEYAGANDFSIDVTLDTARAVRTKMLQSGMVKACLAPGSTLQGVAAC
jgi:prepilin-type N-terminal cleavage/methylation domain-containing protein